MNDKCDYCRTADAEMWISLGSYGIDEPTGVCVGSDCIDKARIDMINHADAVLQGNQ